MILRIVLLFILAFPTFARSALDSDCEAALKTLFARNVTKEQASDFLRLQGDITLHRMAWAFLKAQKVDHTQKLENVQNTILTLLDQKYTSTDPDFIKARNQFEAQPLSRAALADIGPYLKEVMSHEFGADSKLFILNASDLKLLAAVAKFEKDKVVSGNYDSRMLSRRAPQGMLNFAKLINSQYKKSSDTTEEAIGIDLKLQGLEKTIKVLQRQINSFLRQLAVPTACRTALDCKPNENLAEFFAQNENIQNIFWNTLGAKLTGDDVLMDNLSYGKIWLNGESSTGGNYTSSTGLYLKDPVSILLKDNPERTAASFKDTDRDYIHKMADAIINDEKVFELDGKIYSRKSGRVLKPEAAITLLAPSKRSTPDKKSPFFNEQIVALVNGDKSFVYGNKLYLTTSGRILDPASTIATEMNHKSPGAKVSPEIYKGMGESYLLLRAGALTNNKPHFKVGNQVYDTETGKNLTSATRAHRRTEDVKLQKKKRVQYQNLSDAETIINFHRDTQDKSGCQHYAIVDKKYAEISVYSLKGEKVFTREVLIGVKASDQKTGWTKYNDREHLASNTTGAGAFTVGSPKSGDYYSKTYNNNLLQIEDQRVFALHQVPNKLSERYTQFGTGDPQDRRISGGCVNLKQADFRELANLMKPTCKIYVLPEEKNNKFIVKDGAVQLVSTTMVTNSSDYNYSTKKAAARPIAITITNGAGKTVMSKIFVKTLETEKIKLMENLNLSNDEYNDLAALSYGIMGNESKFGYSKLFWYKEMNPDHVMYAKAAKKVLQGGDPFVASTVNLSKGLTQIKDLPGGKWREAYPEINKESLINPKHAAVATMAYLADALRSLKNVAADNAKDSRKVKITKETLVEYLGYIYQGRKKDLVSTTSPANTEFNKYCQQLKKHMSYIEIAQKIE